jgi:hypothetical protein
MKLNSFVAVARVLEEAGVRYLVAGGLAVNAHGYLRYTKDVDLVVQLVPDNIINAFAALASIGYKPLVPITASQFANAEMRNGWIREKNMTVLQFWSDVHKETPIDVFVAEPFPFEDEHARSLSKPLQGSLDVRFVSLATLIDMKTAVGRPQDLIDVEHLKMRMDSDDRE